MATTGAAPFTIRLGGPDDDPAIAALLGEAVPGTPKADLEVLRWQYRREVYGPTLTVVAEADGRLVGHYSAITVPLRLDGTVVSALRGVDIATAPDHRGRGVFRRVAARLLDEARATTAPVLVSTPNDRSIGTLLALGWQHVVDPAALVAVLEPEAVTARAPRFVPAPVAAAVVGTLARRLPGPPATGAVEVLDTLPPDLLDDLDTLLVPPRPGDGLHHDRRWWAWRYGDHPRPPYRYLTHLVDGRVRGIGVVSPRDDAAGPVFQLLDLVAADRASARAVVHGATSLARQLDLGALVAATTRSSTLHHQLRDAGFVTIPTRLLPRPIHLTVADLRGSGRALAARPWTFSLGDQDHL